MSATTRLLSTSAYGTSTAYGGREYGSNLTDDFGTIPATTPEEEHAAGLMVCAMAADAEEAAELLAMLGLARRIA